MQDKSDVKKDSLSKKSKHGKIRKKKILTNKTTSQNEGFSTNWKNFLEQQKKVADAAKKTSKQTVNSKKPISQSKENGKDNSLKRKRKRKVSDKTETINMDEIWFDVDHKLLDKKICTAPDDSKKRLTEASKDPVVHTESNDNGLDENKNEVSTSDITRYIALDCEMVGVGIEGKESILARVSIVNSHGQCLYDKYVMPKEKVIDYRTDVSGISPIDLKNAVEFSTIQKEVSDLLKNRILVGHALQNDMKVLMMSHPKKFTRDTSRYKPFHKLLKTKRPSLKRLAKEILQQEIQVGAHNSVVDAQITMQIFKKYKKEWEKSLHSK